MKKLTKDIHYSSHYVDKEDIASVVKVLNSKNLTQGPNINIFEKKICKIVGSKYAVAVTSCTAGLHIACKALGFNKNSTLLTSSISFVSSANIAHFLGGQSQFVDIKNDHSISFDLVDLEKKIREFKPLIVIPVHMGGVSFDHEKLKKLSLKYKFKIVEDAAHSFGGNYNKNFKIGSCKYSELTVFSFHPVKTITTGEGGVITTNSKYLYKKLLRLRSHGINKLDDVPLIKKQAYTNNKKNQWYYEMRELGYHYRMTDLQAALGISQLKKLNKIIQRRKFITKYYDRELKNLPITLCQIKKREYSSNHLYIIWINFKKLKTNRQTFMNYLEKNRIFTQVHYLPIYMHPFYSALKLKNTKKLINSKRYYEGCLSLPCHYKLSNSELKIIVKKIKYFFLR